MISNYNYWYFVNAIPPGVCDEIIKIGLSKQKGKALVDSIKDKANKNLYKVRDSDIVWLNDLWLRYLVGSFVNTANINADWNFTFDYPEEAQFTIYDKNQHYNWHQDLSFDKNQKTQPLNHMTNELFRKKGTVVVFPSYMHHKVTPVTQGVRYSLVMWFRGPAFQ